MTLCEELYFEIKLTGTKSNVKKFISYLKSGELDEFFEVTSDYIHYSDEFETLGPDNNVEVVFSNDDWGIEIDEFDTDEFLEVFCKAGKEIHIKGSLFDIDDEEYSFISSEGDSYYVNAKKRIIFNDEIDEKAFEEDMYED